MGHRKVMGFYEPHDAVDYTGELVNPLTGEVTRPPSMTKQEFVAECDINNIIREYTMTGVINHINTLAQNGTFEDLPDNMDYQESLNTIMAADHTFSLLPSKIRDRFENDPEQFLAFCADPTNLPEMRELGLAKPLQEPAPSASPPEGGTGGGEKPSS